MVNKNKSKRIGKRLIAFAAALTMVTASLTGCGKDTAKAEPAPIENPSIYIAPIANYDDTSIRGMDISSILVEEASGVKYYNANGEEEDLFKILSDNGVNYIRVRVWNDPYDADGHGYGGGNNDANAAAEIGKRAAEYGMKLNVDFHYSDFWADPKKQMCPKAWKGMDIDSKAQALYDYTVESLKTILDAGADVGMVQIGNEINNGLAGETKEENIMDLLKQASKAVRDVSKEKGKDIKIAVHYTEVDDVIMITKKALRLSENEIDYDIFGISYYPFWHGKLRGMKNTLNTIKATYGKDVCVLETSFPYTDEDGDGFGNSVSAGDITGEYTCSIQSHANSVWDIMDSVSEIGGLGVFYWEGAWIPVGSDGNSNKEIWNEKGSGWASKYSASYDPNDAGKYYGGSSWDNQAFFDHEGHVLDSLAVFNPKFLTEGNQVDPKIEMIPEVIIEISQGSELTMPETVYAVYNDRSLNGEIHVFWDEGDINNVDTRTGGDYNVKGLIKDGATVNATVKVSYANLLENSGFEDGLSPWTVSYSMDSNPTDIQTKAADALAGEKAFHFWSGSEDEDFWVEQTVTIEEDGNYSAFGSIQGGDAGDHYVELYIKKNGETVAMFGGSYLTGWVNWHKLEVEDVSAVAGDELTVGMSVKCQSGGWGTIDEFCLYKD